MDSVGVVAPHLGVLRSGRGHAGGRPEVPANPRSEEISDTVARTHWVRTIQQAGPLDWMRGRCRADAGARSVSCGRRSASRRGGGSKSIQSTSDRGPGPDADGPSALCIQPPRLSRPELDRWGCGSGPISPRRRREPARSVRDPVDPSAVRTGRELRQLVGARAPRPSSGLAAAALSQQRHDNEHFESALTAHSLALTWAVPAQ